MDACETRITGILERLEKDIEDSNAALVQKGGIKKRMHADKASQNDLVYMGLGTGAGHEVEKMEGRVREGITDIRQQGKKGDTTVLTEHGLVDVGSREGVKKFLNGMPLEKSQKKSLAKTFSQLDEHAKDEAAQLVQILQQADKGERQMERVVLSGHSNGTELWGDDNGGISFSQLAQIAKQFPDAAAQVEDLMLSACNSGGEALIGQYRKIFPKLKTIWAYSDSAPGAASGAVTHMKIWEKATRGKGTQTLDPTKAKRTRKGKNVATWSEEEGYKGQEQRDIHQVLDEIGEMEDSYQAFLTGQREVKSTANGPMRSYYRLLNEALGNPALPSGEKAALQRRKAIALRVLFFKLVRKKFWEAHHETISSAYQGANLPVPKFPRLGRGDAIQAVHKLKSAGGDSGAVELLQSGIIDLSPKVIPTSWI